MSVLYTCDENKYKLTLETSVPSCGTSTRCNNGKFHVNILPNFTARKKKLLQVQIWQTRNFLANQLPHNLLFGHFVLIRCLNCTVKVIENKVRRYKYKIWLICTNVRNIEISMVLQETNWIWLDDIIRKISLFCE